MRRVRILQIGDIHYPDWNLTPSEIDEKDRKFAPSITSSIRGSAFRSVLKKLGQLASSDSVHGIIFVGDFTTRGQSEFLEGAFQHFSLLCRSTGVSSRTVPIAFVPGNHDVNRQDALDLGPTEKFRRMSELAQKFGWQSVPLNIPVTYSIEGFGGSVDVTLLNTAIGSWALQNLPEYLRDKLKVADTTSEPIDLGSTATGDGAPAAPPPTTVASPPTNLVDQYYGQLDTPYVSDQMLAGLLDRLRERSVTYGIVVGHHNLLPQKTPRISPYAEVLNAGFVRHQLLSTNKPILYLHGHIHQDPVEIVSDPRQQNSKIVLISAPEIRNGFNELILFLTDQDEFVGLRLIPHRSKVSDGALYEDEHCFISMMPNFRASLDEKTFGLLQQLKEHRAKRGKDLLYWNELHGLSSAEMQDDALEDALLMLHSAQEIEIDGLNKPTRDWRIQIKGL
ncbi:metallophosphoesterase [Rhizobium sp. CG5]|uniref:metallophosphoesterase family protein n=1 Tax=Rhizobium sp. CG5 TaxID=2726076 RepID=UPI002033B849|nr:metallophosphoesterase [Rhizobium sp. CG5]MCM2477776.1 metallophosphoesterase [Rhizobium sp. CG5]